MTDKLAHRIANSPWLLLLTFCVTMLLAATAYSIAESTDLPNSLYWALVTATSLGYGDISPHSFTGKFLTSLLIGFTVFILIPTITANVASWLIVSRDAWTHDEQEQLKAELAKLVEMVVALDRRSKAS